MYDLPFDSLFNVFDFLLIFILYKAQFISEKNIKMVKVRTHNVQSNTTPFIYLFLKGGAPVMYLI